jgi:hypothetical protein
LRSWDRAGIARRGAHSTDFLSVACELVDEGVGRAGDRRRVRQALGVPSDRWISDEVIDEVIAREQLRRRSLCPGGLLAHLTKRLVERAMEVELTKHLGYAPHRELPSGVGTSATARPRRR